MKLFSFISLLAISLGALACVSPEGERPQSADPNDNEDATDDVDEETGEAQDALTVIATMGGSGWWHQTPDSSDLVLGHRILGVYNKWAEATSRAQFASLEGKPATQANLDLCKSSALDAYFYKRVGPASEWQSIDHKKVFAVPSVSNGVITSCVAISETSPCAPYHFGAFDGEFEIDIIATGGDGQKGVKKDIVRYRPINIANCF